MPESIESRLRDTHFVLSEMLALWIYAHGRNWPIVRIATDTTAANCRTLPDLPPALPHAAGDRAIDTLRAMLAVAPDDATRHDLLESITEDYCLHCGRHIPDGVCHCMRDD